LLIFALVLWIARPARAALDRSVVDWNGDLAARVSFGSCMVGSRRFEMELIHHMDQSNDGTSVSTWHFSLGEGWLEFRGDELRASVPEIGPLVWRKDPASGDFLLVSNELWASRPIFDGPRVSLDVQGQRSFRFENGRLAGMTLAGLQFTVTGSGGCIAAWRDQDGVELLGIVRDSLGKIMTVRAGAVAYTFRYDGTGGLEAISLLGKDVIQFRYRDRRVSEIRGSSGAVALVEWERASPVRTYTAFGPPKYRLLRFGDEKIDYRAIGPLRTIVVSGLDGAPRSIMTWNLLTGQRSVTAGER
jgi:hypothetical protein